MNNIVDDLMKSLFENMEVLQKHIDSKKSIIASAIASGITAEQANDDWNGILFNHWNTLQFTRKEIEKARKQ